MKCCCRDHGAEEPADCSPEDDDDDGDDDDDDDEAEEGSAEVGCEGG